MTVTSKERDETSLLSCKHGCFSSKNSIYLIAKATVRPLDFGPCNYDNYPTFGIESAACDYPVVRTDFATSKSQNTIRVIDYKSIDDFICILELLSFRIVASFGDDLYPHSM